MPNTLRFDPEAPDDIQHAVDWYEANQGVHRAAAFCAAVDAAFDLIEAEPDRFARAFDDLTAQFARLKRFPYFVIFQRYPGDVLMIAGVFHQSSDPERWRARLTR